MMNEQFNPTQEFLDSLSGKSIEEAEKLVVSQGGMCRIVLDDSGYSICTDEFIPTRINLATKHGIVEYVAYVG